jgi:predicted Fe-S protein YdhL (DUF1289 family)
MNLKTQPSSNLPAARVKSPCVRECLYDHDKDLCTGCGRTLDELSYWNDYTNQEKKEMLEKCKKRLDSYENC